MILLRCIILLQFAITTTFAQHTGQGQPVSLPNEPRALIESLYQQVVLHHPIGIPQGADMKTFAPYLSKTLLHKIDVAIACAADYDRQYPDPNLKPPFAWLEAGLFSGDDEQATPSAFVVERTRSQKDGSIRVYVKLTYEERGGRPWIWHVSPIVVRENGHFVVNDVIYLKDETRDVDSGLSEYLSKGCSGSRWVGFGSKKGDPKQRR